MVTLKSEGGVPLLVKNCRLNERSAIISEEFNKGVR